MTPASVDARNIDVWTIRAQGVAAVHRCSVTATLAATLMQHDLIDEYQIFVSPVVLGDGTHFFPGLRQSIELALLETRTFGTGVVYLRYERR